MTTALALLTLAIWLVLLFARDGFWRVAANLGPGAGTADTSRIVAIVPARNEADVLPVTLPALLAQGCRVILVDDASEDGTAAVARAAAAGSDRLTVVPADPLRPGWTGKLNALATGLTHANTDLDHANIDPARTDAGLARTDADLARADAGLVLFTDADILWHPGTLSRLAAEKARHGAVLASLMVRLRAHSAAERWLVPAFVYFFAMLYPFRAVNRATSPVAAAAGGVMLVDRAALEAAGGLAAVRGALIDDCAIARLMKRQGPIRLTLTTGAQSVRRYDSLASIAAMVMRSAYAELRYSRSRLAVAILGLALVFLAPPVYALAADGLARVAGIVAWIIMAATFMPMVGLYRLSPLRAAALPVVAAAYAAFTLGSAIEHARGRGGAWKGRVQGRVS